MPTIDTSPGTRPTASTRGAARSSARRRRQLIPDTSLLLSARVDVLQPSSTFTVAGARITLVPSDTDG